MKANCDESERQREAEAVAAIECAQLRAELANLRAELDQRRRADFEAILEVVGGRSNDVLDQVEALTNRMLAELFDKLDSMFAALQARLDAILSDAKGAFRSARERADEASELPNPLPPRRAIN
jgi:chromosome segregation ATPase